MRACVHACVHACVRVHACVCMCVHVQLQTRLSLGESIVDNTHLCSNQ